MSRWLEQLHYAWLVVHPDTVISLLQLKYFYNFEDINFLASYQ